MGIIRKLDANIANKIAAGEVVEKLANVVKELVENAIDAESTKIDIDLIDTGMKLIKVSDNGKGMDESDALLAFERHATSKIKDVNDLFRIQSLGFRGEALPSIAAISRVELTTSNGEESLNVIYEDGRFIQKNIASVNQGTIISVSKLFYSTPARFKYLKSPQTELSNIVSLVHGFALANPTISFRLTNDKKVLFVSNKNDSIPNLIAKIYGVQVGKSLMYFENESRDYHIFGYTTNPIINRSSRNYINIIVNNRTIQNNDITKAITEVYDQLIPKNRYPISVLFIEVDPLLIDVNIHPRKQEIKFSEKDKLIALIKSTLKEKLEITNIYQKPSVEHSQTKMRFFEEESSYNSEKPRFDNETITETEKETVRLIPDMDYIGQFSGTYLIWQNEEGLYLLDQHAAAERIRYEKYYQNMISRNNETINLLTPLIIEYPQDILIRLAEKLVQLIELGIKIEIGESQVSVFEIPNWIPKDFEEIYLEQIIQSLTNNQKVSKEFLLDDLAKLLACKHSLKANHYITKTEAVQLLNDLRNCQKPYTCPHGRPIIVDISQRQIEYWFNRVI